MCERSVVIFHTITLEIVHSHPRFHIHAIISSVVITDWPCVPTYQMYFVWSARRCLDPHWHRAAQSYFGTAPTPGHVRQVNNLVFWVDDATATRASSVVGYASDTANAVAKVEPNSNRSREICRHYYIDWYKRGNAYGTIPVTLRILHQFSVMHTLLTINIQG